MSRVTTSAVNKNTPNVTPSAFSVMSSEKTASAPALNTETPTATAVPQKTAAGSRASK